MRIDFIKCHGSGNDFPLVDARALRLGEAAWAELARGLSNRAGAVGSDGLLALTAGDAAHAFGFRMWNSDGSESETCLNGVRCVARAGFEALGIDAAQVRLMTSSVAVARAADIAPGVYTVREVAGPATLGAVETAIPQLPSARAFTAVAIPNPHLVTFVEGVGVEAIDEAELVRVGLACEAAPDWLPNRANVSFVRVDAADALFVRTFERGVGLTNSCGSAMAASTYAACLTARCAWDRDVTVRNAGGLVMVRAAEDGMIAITGNASFEWRGIATIDPDTGTLLGVERGAAFAGEAEAWARVAQENNRSRNPS